MRLQTCSKLRGHDVGHHLCKTLTERPVDEDLPGRFDRVEPRASLFAAQCLEFLVRGWLTKVVATHRDIDVLGKAIDQSE